MKFSLFSAVLLVWMRVGELRVYQRKGFYSGCCHTVTNRIPTEFIVNYHIPYMQDMCPIKGVIFVTRRNRIICSDQDARWVKKAIEKLNRKWIVDGLIPDCCLTVTDTRVRVENIVKYDIQEPPLCPIRAVRFLTNNGKYICSDPDVCWAIRAINRIYSRKNMRPYLESTKCKTHRTNTIPTTTSTNKTRRPKTETSSTTSPDPSSDCCLTVTDSRTAAEDILDYEIQDPPLCPVRAVRFITVQNDTICSSPAEDWVQDYIRRKTPEKTDPRELETRPPDQDRRSTETTETSPEINHHKHFCLKREPVQYFCVKTP